MWALGVVAVFDVLPEDLPDVVVPYNTDGKFRAGKVYLIKKLEPPTGEK